MNIFIKNIAALQVLIIGMSCAQTSLASQESENIAQAISFLRSACVTSGSSLEIKASGDGSLQVKSILGSGVKGAITLTKKELEGFADAASSLGAQQASEMRACMRPYIDRILATMLSGAADSGAKAISIQTDGSYFVTSEFDKVMKYVASKSSSGAVNASTVERDTGIEGGKVILYFEIANKNSMGFYSSSYPPSFKMYGKGLSYIYSRMSNEQK